jgi:signal transduction histidine kinase
VDASGLPSKAPNRKAARKPVAPAQEMPRAVLQTGWWRGMARLSQGSEGMAAEVPRKARPLATAGMLAAGLAHEIRNPLNGVSLHLSVLERALAGTPNVPSAAADAIAVLRTETKRLSVLVTDFLEVARPRQLVRVECDLNEIARGVAALQELELEGRAITLRLEPSPEPAVAELDVERIKKALVNLLHNAVEATGGHGSVVLRVRRTPSHAEFDVEDDGAGFAALHAPIFDAFYTTKERGTGLGLSIVQRVVSDHGGEVVYTTQPGRTVFTVRLPIRSRSVGGT